MTVEVVADTPGPADLQFLLGGTPLGESVSIKAEGSTGEGSVRAVFTRTLPADLPSGSYVVEVVNTRQLSQVLASATIDVVAELPMSVVEPTSDYPTQKTTDKPGLAVVLAVVGATALAGIGLGFTARYRRKTIVRRISRKGQ